MFIVREVMHCRPGKVRPLVEKFVEMGKLMDKHGMKAPRVMTDVSGPQYWTLCADFEVGSLEEFFGMDKKLFSDPRAGEIMEGYHDLVQRGRREIYKLEG